MSRTSSDGPVTFRPARREELALLPRLELDATQRFHQLAELVNIPDDVTPLHELEAAWDRGLVWVAEVEGEIAGYAYAAPLDGRLHLEEISVLQRFGRRGIGRRLVMLVIDHARDAGYAGVSLTTFREVPWNAPFYRSMGFREFHPGEIGPGISDAIAAESRRGLPAHLRLAMMLPFARP